MKKKGVQKIYIRDGRAPVPKSSLTSRTMSSIRGKNTKPEIALRKRLVKSGLRGYRLHWKKAPGRPDICYPAKRLAIFVHGCFWHRCPKCRPVLPKTHRRFWGEKFRRNKIRDKRKCRELKKVGWRTLTIWECEIRAALPLKVKEIADLLSE